MSDDHRWQPPANPDHTPDQPEPPSSPAGADGNPSPTLPPPAQHAAPPPPAAEAPAAAPGAPSVDTPLQSEPDRKRRTPMFVGLAAVAVIVIGLAGIFAVRRMSGDAAGGAATPEELGDNLLDTLDRGDVLGAIDLLLPGERETLGDPFVDAMSELRRLEVLASDLDLSNLAAVDVELSERNVDVSSTNVADIVHVDVSADAVVTLDGAEVPIGELITDRLPDETVAELTGTSVTESDSLEFEFTAVQQDDQWYLSLWYTAAEAARAEVGADIPVEGIGAVGAESPEAALDGLVDKALDLDLRGILQGLDPYEAEALQRYAPLFLADAEQAIEQLEAEAPELGSLDEIIEIDSSYRIDGSGSSRTAFVESYEIRAEYEGVQATVTYADGCLQAEVVGAGPDPIDEEICAGADALGDELAGAEIPPEVGDAFDAVTEAFADMDEVGIELRERDGEWYLAPIATTSEAGLAVLRALDRDEIDRIVDEVERLVNEFGDEFAGGLGALGGVAPGVGEFTVEEGVETSDEPIAVDDELGDLDDELGDFDDELGDVDDELGDLDDELGDVDEDLDDVEASAADECYSVFEVGEAIECFQSAIDAGADPAMVPAVIRFPECGLAEAMWGGEIYSMSDADFMATVTAAKPCFDDLVASGELDEWELPIEVIAPDCFEGRNIYAADDDAGLDEVYDCLYSS